jgi:hypothetical protein
MLPKCGFGDHTDALFKRHDMKLGTGRCRAKLVRLYFGTSEPRGSEEELGRVRWRSGMAESEGQI